MQSFAKRIRACRGYRFFVSTKELGVWGLAPENNSNTKTNFDKVKNFLVYYDIFNKHN